MRNLLPIGAALILSGCASYFETPARPDPIVKVMGSVSECGIDEAGIHGAKGASVDFDPALANELAGLELSADRQALVVALGPQATPGYSLTVLNARWFGDSTLNVTTLAQTPAEERMHAQVISHPCVILEVPSEGWDQIRVEADLNDFPVAWVRRSE